MRFQTKKLTVADLPIGSKYMSPDGACIKASNLKSYGLGNGVEINHSTLDLFKTTPLKLQDESGTIDFKDIPNGYSFKYNGDLCIKSACGGFAIRLGDGHVLTVIPPYSKITEIDTICIFEPQIDSGVDYVEET